MTVICLDTQILSWGLVDEKKTSNLRMARKAVEVITELLESKHDIIIPTIVLGELLTPVAEEKIVQVTNKFEKDWQIVPYDARSAYWFSRLRRQINLPKINEDGHHTRKELIADTMIIATAIAHNANQLYTSDKGILKILHQHILQIEAVDFTTIETQLPLELPDEGTDD